MSSDSSTSTSANSNSTQLRGRTTTTALLQRYESLVQSGDISRDVHQIRALRELDRLREDCLIYLAETAETEAPPSSSEQNERDANNGDSRSSAGSGDGGGWSLTNLFSWANTSKESLTTTVTNKPKGVYLHGGVGCGKTYCMDLFYNSLPPNNDSNRNNNTKQKVHFHKFMLNIHKSIHVAKTQHKLQGSYEIINYIVHTTLSRGKIICFDEFQVTDIADALILKRLFTSLLLHGAVIVATSNRCPSDLYKGGLQRDLFVPFIDLLYEECEVISMWDSDMDYRLVQSNYDEGDGSYDDNSGKTRVYFVEEEKKWNGDDDYKSEAKDRFDKLFRNLTKGSIITSIILSVQGRDVVITKASEEYNIARFTFHDLCGTARGAADYLAIGERFHTVFIEDVPKLHYHEVNLVRRWITLIDAFYENHVKVVILAKVRPEDMFQVDLENEFCDEVFAFDRTRSRMEEMRSEKYLRKKWTGHLQFSDDVDRARQIDYMQGDNKVGGGGLGRHNAL